ncbi:MAG TPA: ArsR family transcriptional regulator [Symbiobacteriaceae bacterium]|nr:ArsR family transcriptional regulator [Symbiobacteriaceae bacterium]
MSPRLLETRSGLTRNTVLKGLRQLKAEGWLSATEQDGAAVPVDLIFDKGVCVQAKLLYGGLRLTPGFDGERGQFTYAALSHLAGVSVNTAKKAITALRNAAWLETTQFNRNSPVRFSICDPVGTRRLGEVNRAAWRLEEAEFKGEALMREYLTLLADCDEFEDNARPGFLINPFTGERMQYDRYYPPQVAFEFNGAQHYHTTERYTNEGAICRQQGRDLLKQAISANRRISLVVVHPEDLSLEAMQRKVAGLLPLRDLADHQPLITYLEEQSAPYRRKARQAAAKRERGRPA